MIRGVLRLLAPVLTAAVSTLALAESSTRLVPEESQIAFVSKQMGVPVEGQFKRFAAELMLDPKKPEGGSVALRIDTASATFGIRQTDAELPRTNWFDVAHFPQASFVSSGIKGLGYGRFEVAGRLTVKGQSQPVTIPVQITQADGKSTASGTFAVKRLEFRIGDGEWTDTSIVADEVQVRFKLVFTGLAAL
jgi:polyisoprenoid-binding protein YceI